MTLVAALCIEKMDEAAQGDNQSLADTEQQLISLQLVECDNEKARDAHFKLNTDTAISSAASTVSEIWYENKAIVYMYRDNEGQERIDRSKKVSECFSKQCENKIYCSSSLITAYSCLQPEYTLELRIGHLSVMLITGRNVSADENTQGYILTTYGSRSSTGIEDVTDPTVFSQRNTVFIPVGRVSSFNEKLCMRSLPFTSIQKTVICDILQLYPPGCISK